MNAFVKDKTANLKNDALSGITVSLAMIPEVVAFAFVAQISPIMALFGAFVVGIITATFGGRPGLISGAAGAVAVIFVNMIQEGHAKGLAFDVPVDNMGWFYLFATVVLMGVIQIIAGVFKLGKFVRLIPHPVMMGFVNGLAIVIFIAQLGMFKSNEKDLFGNNKRKTHSKEMVYSVIDGDVKDVVSNSVLFKIKDNSVINTNTNLESFVISDGQVFDSKTKQVAFNYEKGGFFHVKDRGVAKSYMYGENLYWMIGLVLLTMLIVWLLPKLTTKIPAALTAILVITLIVVLGGDYVTAFTVGDFIRDGQGIVDSNVSVLDGYKEISSRLNIFETWSYLPFNLDTLKFIFPYAFLAASVGLIETLMTTNLVDELTDTRGKANKECIAQGAGNIISGLFGGTGGCGMIGQTVINLKAGGRGRFSGVMMALTLLVFILFAGRYIEQVPIAALVGVMFMMVIETFAWSSFRILRKIPISDAVVLILVSAVTVFFDLAIAVFIGVIISALVFAWESAKRIRARKSTLPDGTKVYEIWGPLFFGSIQEFNNKFDIKNDPNKIIIDFMESRVSDHSALEALGVLVDKYKEQNKEVSIRHLSASSKDLILKNNPSMSSVIEDNIEDPRYHVMSKVLG